MTTHTLTFGTGKDAFELEITGEYTKPISSSWTRKGEPPQFEISKIELNGTDVTNLCFEFNEEKTRELEQRILDKYY